MNTQRRQIRLGHRPRPHDGAIKRLRIPRAAEFAQQHAEAPLLRLVVQPLEHRPHRLLAVTAPVRHYVIKTAPAPSEAVAARIRHVAARGEDHTLVLGQRGGVVVEARVVAVDVASVEGAD